MALTVADKEGCAFRVISPPLTHPLVLKAYVNTYPRKSSVPCLRPSDFYKSYGSMSGPFWTALPNILSVLNFMWS